VVLSAYQVNNVLRVYGNQLRHSKLAGRPQHTNTCSPDRVNISAVAKRKSTIDKITADIVNRIIQNGPGDNLEKEVFQKLENEHGSHLAVNGERSYEPIFMEIDENGETLNTLSIEDSVFLSHKLKEITRETIDKNML
jgi:hypothetical protein